MQRRWSVGREVLSPGQPGTFDETAVKDPSVVFFEGQWHVFYTARGGQEYTTGYIAATSWEALNAAPRHELTQVRGRTHYGCAPQVFFFRPQNLWYLVFQSNDTNYQPQFVTTTTLHDPTSWTAAQPLLSKDTDAKWIDFWVLCDESHAYLYYTQDHQDVMMRHTTLSDFPRGWGSAQVVFPEVHEAVHVYKVAERDAFHLIYERNTGERSFGLAYAPHPLGPWTKVMEDYATGAQLIGNNWTDMVSHGEALRVGFDERLEYDADYPQWLIQGLKSSDYVEPYPEMPWKLGIISTCE